METSRHHRSTIEEKLVWVAVVFTYPIFFLGATYLIGCLIGWAILACCLLRLYIEGFEQGKSIPVLVWLWIIAMLVMLVALIVGHLDYNLGLAKIVKSSIGWMKGWALIAIFFFIGAIAPIKPEVIVRACCILCMQALPFVCVGLLFAVFLGKGHLYTSPLSVIGGPGIAFFTVELFGINPETHLPRWRFFCPWAPAAGFLSCLLLIICAQEKNIYWRSVGIFGALVMCLFCQSRAGLALFAFLLPCIFFLHWLKNPLVCLLAILCITAIILFGSPLLEYIMSSYADVKASRPKSTEVRRLLAEIALQRWQSEAPLWGHGIVENGPKIVEFMPIGSHHSWYGLLFVKGIVGFLALAIPLACTFFYFLGLALFNAMYRSALLIVVTIIGYSFFENLEILSYVIWPALLWLGICFNLENLNKNNTKGLHDEKV